MPETVKTSEDVNAPNRAAGSLLAAYVIGLVLGGTAALLLAPRSGSETRRAVSEKARKGREKATVVARQGREFVQRRADQVNKAVETGRRAYRKVRKHEQDAA